MKNEMKPELNNYTDQNTAMKKHVLSITRMTSHNGPGFRTLVLFKGCPLRCVWCSTPESQELGFETAVFPKKCTNCGYCVPICPQRAITLTENGVSINREVCNNCGECAKVCYPEAIKNISQWMSVEEILEEVEKDRIIYKHSGGGVNFSGGEPLLLQPDFNRELFSACKNGGINVAVTTSGHVPWTNIEQVLPYVDFFLWDIKHMDPQKHQEYTGVSNKLILSNLRLVSMKGIPLYIRIPVIPGYNDSIANISATCKFVQSLRSVVTVDLLPVHHLGRARYESIDRPYLIDKVDLISDEVMLDLKRLVESFGLECRIGG